MEQQDRVNRVTNHKGERLGRADMEEVVADVRHAEQADDVLHKLVAVGRDKDLAHAGLAAEVRAQVVQGVDDLRLCRHAEERSGGNKRGWKQYGGGGVGRLDLERVEHTSAVLRQVGVDGLDGKGADLQARGFGWRG